MSLPSSSCKPNASLQDTADGHHGGGWRVSFRQPANLRVNHAQVPAVASGTRVHFGVSRDSVRGWFIDRLLDIYKGVGKNLCDSVMTLAERHRGLPKQPSSRPAQ